jgi:hypothetical protein
MAHDPRSIAFIERAGRVKHYSIAMHDRVARPALVDALRDVSAEKIGDAFGFTIAHDAACVRELEVIDFERRAWLDHVLIGEDLEGYLQATLEPVDV